MTFIEDYAQHYDIDRDQAVARFQIAADLCQRLADWTIREEPYAWRSIDYLEAAAKELEIALEEA